MTVDTNGGDTVAPYSEDEFNDVGLEDVGAGDVVIPRLSIVHDEGKIKNNLTGEVFDNLTVVLLGLVKQRIMWDEVVDTGDKPQCKSPDFIHGFPQMRTDIPVDKQFPWARSNFNPADYPASNGENGHVTLPCEACVFSQWGKGDNGKNTPPPCSEQHTFPLLYNAGNDEEVNWAPALFTVQKTGIKPSRSYISSFAASKTPMFTVYTDLWMTQVKRGNVTYSTPNFRRNVATERAYWGEYANQLRTIRSFIRAAPRVFDDAAETEPPAASSNENTAPVNVTPPAQPAAAPPANTPPASTPPPAMKPPGASAPKAPTPPTPPSAPAPAASAPAEQMVPESTDDDDLPF